MLIIHVEEGMNVRVIDKNVEPSACQAGNGRLEVYKAGRMRDVEHEGLDAVRSKRFHGL